MGDSDPELQGKVLLPCLGDRLEACLARGEIALR
jgi:maltooligosyltrehalose synthase